MARGSKRRTGNYGIQHRYYLLSVQVRQHSNGWMRKVSQSLLYLLFTIHNFLTLVFIEIKYIVMDASSKIDQLNSFDAQKRMSVLEELCGRQGDFPPEAQNVNMHCHSFFSYNPLGWSPVRIAWEARNAGLYAAGLCDFDVLEGLEEFYTAGEILGLRTAVHIETRVFVKEFADKEISSPGEPGIAYMMGAGFAEIPERESREAEEREGYMDRACQRNRDLVVRINEKLPDIAVDYEQDIKPLSPSGTPTERHIVQAYRSRAEQAFGSIQEVNEYWAGVIGMSERDISPAAGTHVMDDLIRSKLTKQGGIGYVQPSEDTFPSADRFIEWVLSCGAVPMIAWLDGTSRGEQDPYTLFACLKEKGAAALNIIPERNWNINDPEEKKIKEANLKQVMQAAEEFGLPVNIGTEMNRPGQPFYDDLKGENLAPYRDDFLNGARIMVGHTLLSRFAGYPYTGERAETDFPSVHERNAFFARTGSLPPLDTVSARMLREKGPGQGLEWFFRQRET